MENTERVKIEIIYNSYGGGDFGVSLPPVHRTLAHFWGSPDGVEFPYVVEVSKEEADKFLKVFAEYRWAQKRLRYLAPDSPPIKCVCGNCPNSID